MEGFDCLGAEEKKSFDYMDFLRNTVGEEAPPVKEKSTGEKAWEGIKEALPGAISTVEKLVRKDGTPAAPPPQPQSAGFQFTTPILAAGAGVLALGAYLLFRK